MMNRFAILGAGAWGTAIAVMLAQKAEHQVRLWSSRPDNARALHEQRENVRLLPGVPIPAEVHLTVSIEEAVEDADLIILAIPTAYLRSTLQRVAGAIPSDPAVLSLIKGMENTTFLRPTEIVAEVVGPRRCAVLSGPSHAEEVGQFLPTSVVVASDDLDLARWVQQRFSTDRFRVYTNLDLVGVELAGALKNIVGVAAGMTDGMKLGDNAKAALMTRGLVEIERFAVALGGEHQTFAGLAGMGDLIVTCMSRHGRNRYVGERLGGGESLEEIAASTSKVAEGVNTTRSVYEKAARMGISMPITNEVYRVLYENKAPQDTVDDLMSRRVKSEK